MRNKILKLAVLAMASTAIISQSASAISVDINLTDPDSASYQWGNYAAEYNYSVGGINLAVTGYSYTNGRIRQDAVGNWESWGNEYGLGVEYSRYPDHALDNSRGDYDMLLLSFDEAVSLDSISSGWRYSGSRSSEASIMAYGGDGAYDSFIGKQWSDLLSDEWEGIGDYRIDSLNAPEAVNQGGFMSRYWLVGAYNSTLNLDDEVGTSFSSGNDFWKLKGVSVSVNPVPLPGSLVLFGSALMIFGSLRRKKAVKA
ncbi:putative secreted protein with PEP-CTERM sorting signal [Alteromonadaceae bacterium 2753L.S.0a.02]|nr:putative secreted protein with PEP-CTERM sorting signal [Alteromonadaceae bacterium 2753L.S.0a.02]